MIDNWKKLVDEYSEHNKFLSESIKDKNKRITGLKERVEELEERNSFLERAHRTNINIAEHALEERDRYKQALETIAVGDNHVAEFWDIAKWALEESE